MEYFKKSKMCCNGIYENNPKSMSIKIVFVN